MDIESVIADLSTVERKALMDAFEAGAGTVIRYGSNNFIGVYCENFSRYNIIHTEGFFHLLVQIDTPKEEFHHGD